MVRIGINTVTELEFAAHLDHPHSLVDPCLTQACALAPFLGQVARSAPLQCWHGKNIREMRVANRSAPVAKRQAMSTAAIACGVAGAIPLRMQANPLRELTFSRS